MATYVELYALISDTPLIQRMNVAVAVAAETIRAEDPGTAYHVERIAWAKRALQNIDATARQILVIALAQNRAATVAQINSVTDAALQTIVDDTVNMLL